jgi:hypothetical protein
LAERAGNEKPKLRKRKDVQKGTPYIRQNSQNKTEKAKNI